MIAWTAAVPWRVGSTVMPPMMQVQVRLKSRPRIAHPEPRAGPGAGRPVVRVREPAAVQRQAAAADALGQPDLQALQLGDPVVDARAPAARQPRPVAAGRRAVAG